MGSSSTQGYGASNPQFSYPAQLKMKLEAAMPGIKIHVWNKGVGGQDAPEMVDRMKADVKPEHAHIVVWQVGTNSAIRRDPLTKFAEKLRAGWPLVAFALEYRGAARHQVQPEHVPPVPERFRGLHLGWLAQCPCQQRLGRAPLIFRQRWRRGGVGHWLILPERGHG